ncbi:alpha/beta hydrolase [Acanthopleuribacter pedis]|uniref:Esterase family protein n=1 Tax=Acanthopleuribacter pedis TaxID=442870 RepID=A0A8J7QMI9_9BACT|nr:alpha/beta hydrolase-fold protein [Acanthopleuribacter pedis]MBO1321128.1 esterase family protein [Acanthopleuribacter pedis]
MMLSLLLLLAIEPVPYPTQGLTGDALVTHIEQRIKDQGGTPIIEGTVFHMFYRAEDGREPKILGDFDRWRRGRKPAGTPMTHLAGNWYHFGVPAQPKARLEYLIEVDGKHGPDPRNPRKVASFSGDTSVAQMPDYPDHPELERRPGVPAGKLESFSFKSNLRRNERQVHVYTPAGYGEHRGKLPTLYIADGSAYAKRGKVPTILDNLIADQKIPPVIAVFVDPVDRWLEYRMFTLFRLMLLEELMPHLKQKWRIDSDRQVLIGGSRGGLSTLDLVTIHPDKFIGAIAFAPAGTETDFGTQLRRMEGDPRPQIHILTGSYDFWLPNSVDYYGVMKEKGYRVHFREEPIGHSIYSWHGYLDELLIPILAKATRQQR